MTLALLFWVIMIIWFLFGLWSNWPVGPTTGRPLAGHFIMWVLFAILGWQVFGAAIHK